MRLNKFFILGVGTLYVISVLPILGADTGDVPLSKKQRLETSGETAGVNPIRHEFAKATTDISFKQLLDPSKDKEVIISFLNTFVPQFAQDSVADIEPASVVIPALPRDGDRKEKATFMDLHVKSKSGARYLIEMQVRRHIYFDERALFYLCNTYGRQLSETQMKSHDWYRSLKPTIALQVLDYDSNRIQGITDDKVEDTQVQRVRDHPLEKGDYFKHYFMTDTHSKQQLDHIQMIQVELPRYVKRALFPPQKDFTPLEWWLSVLRHSSEYTQKYIDQLAAEGISMPETVKTAFSRLDFSKWNPDMRREYALQVKDREEFEATYAVERAEGVKEGERSKALEIARNLKSINLPMHQIQAATGLTEDDINAIGSSSI
jgi:predicted transposase/invertase (TIGR01784 family)